MLILVVCGINSSSGGKKTGEAFSNKTMKSYFICSTPRTGSTFLCSLLKSTQVSGCPESYFRSQDLDRWADKWQKDQYLKDKYNFIDYIQASFQVGSTNNNVYASRIMWGTLDELINQIRLHLSVADKSDYDILEKAFKNIKFIYLFREDVVAQAVSRLRAEQTNIWHVSKDKKESLINDSLQYDFFKIKEFVEEAQSHNMAWVDWFKHNQIKPFRLSYESLIQSTESEIRNILKFLDIKDYNPMSLDVENEIMSDALSTEWISKFHMKQL